jgi:glycosyltransferase involved in cell wall biosynthesis
MHNDRIQNPVLSVILPVYNGVEYLAQSVTSVFKQDLQNFEFLIVDDCSTDNSYDWLQHLKDPRITLFKNGINKGLFYNLNYLIKQSRSSLIKLWAQDDIMYPGCLSAFVNFHKRRPGMGFSYSGRDIIDEKGIIKESKTTDDTTEVISSELHARIAYYTGSIAGNIANVCINKNALDKVGLFNEEMKISADFDMWVRLAEYYETGFIRENLIQLRDHDKQLSRNEKFYYNHVKEDLQIYKYLNGYINPSIRKEGEKIMRIQKLNFYYTLMLKAFLKGNIITAYNYYKELSSYTNFLHLSLNFIRSRSPFKQKVNE